MSNIDDVIARSREPGEFTERREFSIARGQAIEKLREFALVDPHYYILELVQSAVANGATYIDIRCDSDSMALSYIGGSFPENALAQLFDFLFASEDDVEHGPLRQLALGVNALMLFEPDEIVIETGNGTLAGTTRAIIRGDEDTVEVGRPDDPLEGTYLRASGLDRGNISHRSSLESYDGNPPEYRAIEDRCLVAPVPILFNQDPVFGYSSQRTPKSLFGFQKTVSFDEGDLYGTIGVARRYSGAVFRMLTHGVWIESTRREFEGDGDAIIDNLGGVVTFDRLRKTADHSAIVRDERYHEMWLRLRPYVNQLVTGIGDEAGYDVFTLSGTRLDNQELLEILRGSEGIVLAPKKATDTDHYYQAARKVGESVNMPVLCVSDEHREIVETLGGRDVEFVTPDLDDESELHFYSQNESPLPERPWLTAPVELGSMSLGDVARQLPAPPPDVRRDFDVPAQETIDDIPSNIVVRAAWLLGNSETPSDIEHWKQHQLDARGQCIRATIYTPEERSDDDRSINVEVRTAQRVVRKATHDAIAPGQLLVIEITDLSPSLLWSKPKGSDKPVAQLIADAVVDGHINDVESAADRGLQAALRADFEPNTNAAQLVLASLTQRVVKRIRDNPPKLRFSVVDFQLGDDVLDIPVLKTVSDRPVSLRDIEQLLQQCHGLLYGVRVDQDAYLEEVDTDRILLVDETLERILVSLVGPGAYVRVNQNDTLAEYAFEDGRVAWCSRPSPGLREYPDFPLLFDIGDPADWTRDDKKECVDGLVDLLIDRVSTDPNELGDWETREWHRNAWRHLQWFALHADDYEFAADAAERLANFPLFFLSRSRTCSPSLLRRLIDDNGHVEMLDGWAADASRCDLSTAVDRQITATDLPSGPFALELAMEPFVLHLLGNKVRGVAEYHLSSQEMESVDHADVDREAMLEKKIVDNEQARGVIGIPVEPVERPAVVVFSEESRTTILREDLGETFGVIGKIRLRQGVEHRDVEGRPDEAARDVISHLLVRLPELAAGDDLAAYDRALSALLAFASGQLRLIARRDATIEHHIDDPLAREVLNSPMFPTDDGLPISAVTLIRDFQNRAATALARGDALDYAPSMLADETPDSLHDWIDHHLTPERIQQPAYYADSTADTAANESTEADPTIRCAEATLEHWLNVLHPATDQEHGRRLHIDVFVDDQGFDETRIDDFCQLHDGSEPTIRRLAINPDHWMTHWLVREGDDSSRPIAWAVLGAYSHINRMLDEVTDRDEFVCQQRVADSVAADRLEMIRAD